MAGEVPDGAFQRLRCQRRWRAVRAAAVLLHGLEHHPVFGVELVREIDIGLGFRQIVGPFLNEDPHLDVHRLRRFGKQDQEHGAVRSDRNHEVRIDIEQH